MRRAKQLGIGAGAVVAALAVVGALHMPFARSLLMRLGGCPFGDTSPAAIDEARRGAVHASRGTLPAPHRPALGFTLDRARLDDIRAWAKTEHLDCAESREGTLVKCKNVPARAVQETWDQGTITEVAFGISPVSKTVVAVTTLRTEMSDHDGAHGIATVSENLAASLGPPTVAAGKSEAIDSPGFHTATVSYAYLDYLATVTATKLPHRGVILREEYLSALE